MQKSWRSARLDVWQRKHVDPGTLESGVLLMKRSELHPKTDEKWNCTEHCEDDSMRQKYRISSLSKQRNVSGLSKVKIKITAMSNKLYEIHRDIHSSTHLCPQKYSGSVSELLVPIAWGDSHTAHRRQEQWLLTHSHQAKTLPMDELQMGHFITTEVQTCSFPGTESTLSTTELSLRSHSLFPTVLII